MSKFNGGDTSLPLFFAWNGEDYFIARTGWIVVYDDEATADEIGASLGREVKHCATTEAYRSKRNLCWNSFSIIRFT